MSLLISGAIVFFVGLLIGFAIACYGTFVLIKNNGYYLSTDGKLKMKIDKEEYARLFSNWRVEERQNDV